MNFIYIFGVLTIALLQVNAKKLSEDERKAVRDMATDCRTAEGGSEQDVEDLIDNKIPESREGKCVGFCMMKQFSMVKEKSDAPGEFVFCKDCLIQMTNAGIEDEEKRKQVQEIIEACESTANPDRCELAADIMTCMNKEAEARGISPDTF